MLNHMPNKLLELSIQGAGLFNPDNKLFDIVLNYIQNSKEKTQITEQ